MDKNKVTEIILWISPLMAIVNYASLIAILITLGTSYTSDAIGDGVVGCFRILVVRYGIVSILRWQARRRFAACVETWLRYWRADSGDRA